MRRRPAVAAAAAAAADAAEGQAQTVLLVACVAMAMAAVHRVAFSVRACRRREGAATAGATACSLSMLSPGVADGRVHARCTLSSCHSPRTPHLLQVLALPIQAQLGLTLPQMGMLQVGGRRVGIGWLEGVGLTSLQRMLANVP